MRPQIKIELPDFIEEEVIARHIGRRIRLRRTELGWSQEVLAKQLGLTFQQIQKYEKGTNNISIVRLFSIAQHLQVDITYFFQGLALPEYESAIDDTELSSRKNLEAMKGMHGLNPRVRKAISNLLYALNPPQKKDG